MPPKWDAEIWKRTLLAGAVAGFLGHAAGAASGSKRVYADTTTCQGGVEPMCFKCEDSFGTSKCVEACKGDWSCDCGDPSGCNKNGCSVTESDCRS